MHFGTTHNEYLVVSISTQNLAGIAAAVFIIRKFEYFVRLAFLGEVFWSENGENGNSPHFYPSMQKSGIGIIQNPRKNRFCGLVSGR